MPNFEENIKVNWMVDEAVANAGRFASELTKAAGAMEGFDNSVKDATTSISGNILSLILDVRELNQELSKLSQFTPPTGSGIAQADLPPGWQSANMYRDPGGKMRNSDSMEAARNAMMGEGYGGGGQIELPDDFYTSNPALAELNPEIPYIPSADEYRNSEDYQGIDKSWAENYVQLQEEMQSQRALYAQYATESARGATLPGPDTLMGNQALGNIRDEMLSQARAYNVGAALDDEPLTQRQVGMKGPSLHYDTQAASQALGEEEMRKYEESAKNTENANDSMTKSFLMAHLQMMAFREGMKLAAATAKEITQDVIGLSDSTARLSFITGESGGAARADLLAGSTAAARYGVGPQQANAGAVTAAQYGAPDVTETAAKIALVFGETEKYDQIVAQVGTTIKRSNGEFNDQTHLLDLLATLYKSAHLSMNDYFSAMQEAGPLSHILNMNMDDTAIAIAKTAQGLNVSSESAAGALGRIALRASQPETQKELSAQFGIRGDSSSEIIKQSAEMMQQFESSGQIEAANKLGEILSGGGGATAGKQILRIAEALRDVEAAQKDNIKVAGEWEGMFGKVGNTIGSHLTELTAAAQNFVNVFANTGSIKGVFDLIDQRISGLTTSLNSLSTTEAGQEQFAQLSPEERQKRIAAFNEKMGGEYIMEAGDGVMGFTDQKMRDQAWNSVGETGNPLIDALAKLTSGNAATQALEQAFYATQGKLDGSGSGTGATESTGLVGIGAPTWIEKPEFGGIRDLPENMTVEQIQKQADADKTLIADSAAKAGVAYDPGKDKTFLLYDQETQSLKAVTTTTDAFNLALRGAKEAADNFAGFRELPKGVSFDALQASVATWTTRIQNFEPGTQDYEKPETTAFWDAGAKVWRTITAPTDALRFAIEENTKKLDEIKGVFNVPSGGEVLVPFAALQSGFVPSDRFGAGQDSGLSQPVSQFESAVQAFAAAIALIDANAVQLDQARQHAGFNYTPRSDTNFDSIQMDQARQHAGFKSGNNGPIQNNVSVHTTVTLDGRVISNNMQTQMYKDSKNTRQVGGGGGGGRVAVM